MSSNMKNVYFSSWLHGSDACLVDTTSASDKDEDQNMLRVKVLLTEATLHKFVSKFRDDSITMTVVDDYEALKLTVKNLK